MRRYLLGLAAAAILSLTGCSTPTTTNHFTAPSTVPVSESVTKVGRHIDDAIKTKDEVKKAIDSGDKVEANKQVDILSGQLDSAKKENGVSQEKIKELDGKVKEVTEGANLVVDKNNKLVIENVKLEKYKSHYYWLKVYLCGLVAAVAVYMVNRFKNLFVYIPAPFNAYAALIGYVGIPVIITTAVWFGIDLIT